MAESRNDVWSSGSGLASVPGVRRSAGTVGLLLDGRYRLEQRRSRDGASSTWEGTDDQLGRPVGIRVVAGRTAPAAVEAARRAASMEDVRLSRVLDVGASQAADGGALGWVITERTTGRPLGDLLRSSPMSATRVRRIVGEAAAALARASSVGLHHRRLDPSMVLVDEAGEVMVTGLEVAAAAAGLPPVAAERAEREDAVALVSLLYAGLTGLWPHGRFSALGAAPTSAGVPVAPADLVGGVPADLDDLCTATLGLYDDGPRTPAELADALTPWGHAATRSPGPSSRSETPEGEGEGEGEVEVDVMDLRDRPRRSAAPSAPAVIDLADDLFHSLESTAPHHPFADEGSPASVVGPAARVGPQGVAGGAWDDAWDEDDDDPWRPAGRTTGQAAHAGATPSVWEDDARAVRRGGGRVVLALVAVAVLALLVVAVANASRIGGVLGLSPSPAATAAAVAGATPSGGASAEAAPPAAGTGAASASGTAAPTITAATALDPLGDGSENDAAAPRAVDGDPATTWNTSTYRSAGFGGLKAGVGLDLDLGTTTTVSSVDVSVAGTGGVLEVRASADGPALATASVGSGGSAPVHVALSTPTATRHVVLWFTTLPRTASGFSAQVSEVSVH